MANLPELFRSNRSLFSDFFRDLDDLFDMSPGFRRSSPSLFTDVENVTGMHIPSLLKAREGWVQPSVDVQEDDKNYYLSFELPGVKQEDIKVDVANDVLTVSGERHHEYREKEHMERHYGCFCRSISLPIGTAADNIKAHYENGVLDVCVPKTEASQKHCIEVQAGRIIPQVAAGKQTTQATGKKKAEH
jgi:HSP20 family protein